METKSKYSKYYPIFSFVLAAMSMYILMAYVGYLSTGEYSILNGDLRDNYIPAIRNLCRDIMNGESIFYTWTYGMGMNTSLYNAYYCYSPFNFLYLIFYNCNMNTVTVVLIILKTGLAAMCFQIFVEKTYEAKGIESVMFSLFYSMCSFQVVFNVQNIIWLDAMIALPLVFLFINRLVKTGRWIGLTLSYAFIFISQFYMGYMIGIASVMYFVICIVLEEDKDRPKVKQLLWKYVMSVCFAVGLSSWVWIPTLLFMQGNTYVGAGKVSILNKNVFDILNQFFWGEVSGYDALFPYIYCGIPSVLMCIMFFTNKQRTKKEKICYGVFLIIMLLSCVFSPLYMLWHGFDEPNSYEYRFAYIISFLVCSLAAKEMHAYRENKLIKPILIGVILCALYIGELFWQKNNIDINLQSNNWTSFAINMGLVVIWMAGLRLFATFGEKFALGAKLVLLFVAAVECITNGYHSLQDGDGVSSRLTNEGYNTWDMCEKWALNEFKKDDSLYRVCYWQGLSPSSGINYGYNSISYFGSADNIRLRYVLGSLGLYQSPRIVCDYGITPVTKMLLGVRYEAYGEKPVEQEDGTVGYTVALEKNENNLSLGFMVDGEVEDYDCLTTNVFENNNILLSHMTGEEVKAFKPIEGDKVSVSGTGIDLNHEGEIYTIECISDEYKVAEEDVNLTFHVEGDENCYSYIENDESIFNYDSYLLEGGIENHNIYYGRMSVSYIKELEKSDGEYLLRIVPDGYYESESFNDIYFYTYCESELKKAFNNLNKEQLYIKDYRDGYVKGDITVTSDSRVLFTSIPYEKGWKATVNGEDFPISPFLYNGFIALELPEKGEYEIELEFTAPGKRIGMLVSIFNVFTVCIAYLLPKMISKRKQKIRVDI